MEIETLPLLRWYHNSSHTFLGMIFLRALIKGLVKLPTIVENVWTRISAALIQIMTQDMAKECGKN